MATFTLTGSATLTLNNRVFSDLADGDAVTITFPNELSATVTGKNKNSIIALNETGSNSDVVMRIIKGSQDDRFMQGLLTSFEGDPASFSLINGQAVARLGDGAGNVVREEYTFEGGVFSRKIDGQQNVAGSTDQGVAVYNLRFSNARRTLG